MKKSIRLLTICIALILCACGLMVGCGETPPPTPPAVTITLSDTTISLDAHQSKQLTATVENSTKSVTWASSDETVATVSDSGLVSSVGDGTCSITATIDDVVATCSVTVVNTYTAPLLSANYDLVAVDKDDEITLIPTVTYLGEAVEGVTYAWESANEAIATVENGVVRGIAYGETTVKVTTTVYEVALEKVFAVSVKNASISFESDNLTEGEGTLDATLTLADGENTLTPSITVLENGEPVASATITDWTVEDDSIVSFDGGVITALALGSTTISGSYAGNTVVISVTVERKTYALEDALALEVGYKDTDGNIEVNIPSEVEGSVVSVSWTANGITKPLTATATASVITLSTVGLPDNHNDMITAEESATLNILTDKYAYTVPAPVYTAFVTSSEELDIALHLGKKDVAIDKWGSTAVILENAYIVLGSDIAYTGTWHRHQGDWYNYNWFLGGVFDGKGHVIDGVISNDAGDAMWDIFAGTIKNVAFTNVIVEKNGNLIARNGHVPALSETTTGYIEDYVGYNAPEVLENIFVQYDRLTTRVKTNNGYPDTNALMGAYSTGQQMKNVYMQIDNLEEGIDFKAFTEIGHTWGCKMEGVYIVANGAVFTSRVTGEPTATDAYGAFNTRADLVAEAIDFSAWDNNYWEVDADGLPIFKGLKQNYVTLTATSSLTLERNNSEVITPAVKYYDTALEGVEYAWAITESSTDGVVTLTNGENGAVTVLGSGLGTATLTLSATVYGKTLTATVSVTVLNKEVTLDGAVKIVTANKDGDGNLALTLPEEIDGEVSAITWTGGEANATLEGSLNGTTLTIAVANLPTSGKTLANAESDGKLTIELIDGSKYYISAPVYTMVVTDSASLDNARALSDGYIVLGANFTYTGAWNFETSGNVVFNGVLDGKGYTIDGVSTSGWNGAMYYSITGTVKNIAFTNVTLGKKATLLNEAGAGYFENIYIHCATAQAVAPESKNGGLIQYTGLITAESGTWEQKFKNIFVQIDNNTTADETPVYFTSFMEKDNMKLNGVYIVGKGVNIYRQADNWGGTAGDLYEVCDTRADLVAKDIDFSAWDNDYWTVDAQGLPLFKTAVGSLGVVGARVNVETFDKDTNANATFNLSSYGVTAVEKVTLDGAEIADATIESGVLSIPKATLYNNAYGEKLIGLKVTDSTNAKMTAMIKIYVVTQEINDADELDAMRNAFDSRKDAWNVINTGYYVLGNDIDYTGRTGWIYDRTLEASGSNTSGITNVYFHGVFDGCGYNIDGVEAKGWDGAMFYSVGGTIKNVSFTNVVLGKKATLINEHQAGNAARFENIYIQCDSVQSVALEGGNKQYTGFFSVESTDWNNYFKNIYIQVDSNITEDGTPVYLTKNAGKKNINGMYAVGTVVEAVKADDWGEGVYAGGVYADRDAMKTAGIDFSGWNSDIWTVDADGLPIFQNLVSEQ